MKRPLFTITLAGVIGTACSTHTMFDADPSRFTVTSTPPAATVYVMGEALGVTPLEILREQVFPNTYPSQLQQEYGTVTLEHQGCESHRAGITNKILEDGLKVTLVCESNREPAALPQSVRIPAATPKPSIKQRLQELKSLFDDGLITEEEHQERRKAILNEL